MIAHHAPGEFGAEILFGQVEPLSCHPATVVRVTGDIDLSTASAFRDVLDLAMERGVPVVVDMAGVDFVGLAGIAVLEDAAICARHRNGGLVIRNSRTAPVH